MENIFIDLYLKNTKTEKINKTLANSFNIKELDKIITLIDKKNKAIVLFWLIVKCAVQKPLMGIVNNNSGLITYHLLKEQQDLYDILIKNIDCKDFLIERINNIDHKLTKELLENYIKLVF